MLGMHVRRSDIHTRLGVTLLDKPRHSPRFGFVGIHRESIVIASTGMRDIIGAAAQ